MLQDFGSNTDIFLTGANDTHPHGYCSSQYASLAFALLMLVQAMCSTLPLLLVSPDTFVLYRHMRCWLHG